MKKQKQRQENFKVKCTITTSNHEKICYPFSGNFGECRLYIYTTALDMMIAKRRISNRQNFLGFSEFDDSGRVYLTIKRTILGELRVGIQYEIIKNN